MVREEREKQSREVQADTAYNHHLLQEHVQAEEQLGAGRAVTPDADHVEQQALLELEDTAARLRRERDTLRNTLNYLTAASAVKDVFPSSPSSG